MMQHALRYASMGLAVFPLWEIAAPGQCACGRADKHPNGKGAGKHPRTFRGVLEATTDAATIKGWWTKWPKANIGVATGPKSGVCIIDLDGPVGLQSGRTLGLRSSFTVLSGNGKQLYYRDMPGLKNSVKTVAPGVDIRADGGYGILPPSRHTNGRLYSLEGATSLATIPTMPTGLLAAPAATTGVGNPSGWIADALKDMRDGNIDTTLFRVCSRLQSDGYTQEDARTLLTPHAERAGATPGHLDDKIANVWARYATNPVAGEPAGAEDIGAFLSDSARVEWLAAPFFAKRSINFVAGLPETLKTWLLIDLALECAAASGTWLGMYPVAPARVLFIDQERFRGETQRRFNSVMAAKGLTREALKDRLYIKCGTTIKLDQDRSFQAFRQELLTMRPELVLVDSFATFHGAPENDRTAIQVVLDRIKELRQEIGCSFIFINHENKMVFQDVESGSAINPYRMMGSVAIVAAAESVLIVRKVAQGTSMVHHAKSTLAESAQSFCAEIKDTPTGITIKAVQ